MTRADLADGIAGCLALWLPARVPDPEQARWLATRFPGALWIAAERLLDADDAVRCQQLMAIADTVGLPIVAAGDVHMHIRERRALQDTLTAIRLKTTVARAGHALFPNGERHLRPLTTLERLYPAAWLAETIDVVGRCTFSLDTLRYEYPEEIVPRGRNADELSAAADRGRLRPAFFVRATRPMTNAPRCAGRSSTNSR